MKILACIKYARRRVASVPALNDPTTNPGERSGGDVTNAHVPSNEPLVLHLEKKDAASRRQRKEGLS